jgi:hypothetical protein
MDGIWMARHFIQACDYPAWALATSAAGTPIAAERFERRSGQRLRLIPQAVFIP